MLITFSHQISVKGGGKGIWEEMISGPRTEFKTLAKHLAHRTINHFIKTSRSKH